MRDEDGDWGEGPSIHCLAVRSGTRDFRLELGHTQIRGTRSCHSDGPGPPLGVAPAIVIGHRREQVIAVTGISDRRNTRGLIPGGDRHDQSVAKSALVGMDGDCRSHCRCGGGRFCRGRARPSGCARFSFPAFRQLSRLPFGRPLRIAPRLPARKGADSLLVDGTEIASSELSLGSDLVTADLTIPDGQHTASLTYSSSDVFSRRIVMSTGFVVDTVPPDLDHRAFSPDQCRRSHLSRSSLFQRAGQDGDAHARREGSAPHGSVGVRGDGAQRDSGHAPAGNHGH